MSKYLVISVCFVILSCAFDSEVNLGDGYVYFSEGKTDNYIFNVERNINFSTNNPTKFLVPRAIIDYRWDKDFITALQVPIISRELLQDESFQLRNPSTYNYWIIDKKRDSIHGPLIKKDFTKKCQELSVSNNVNTLSTSKKYPSGYW